jgi:hypothetical protein
MKNSFEEWFCCYAWNRKFEFIVKQWVAFVKGLRKTETRNKCKYNQVFIPPEQSTDNLKHDNLDL